MRFPALQDSVIASPRLLPQWRIRNISFRWDKMMKRIKNRKGFSMAEVLIVVAIIVVLAGVGFIALMSHMRTMHQLEMDGQAKEIFVAAQNHLAMADSQGYLGMKESDGKFGTASTLTFTSGDNTETDDGKGIYYFVVGGAGTDSPDGDNVLNQMLPFASVDESARSGGSYIIRYQKDPAQILDVFYVSTSGRYSHTFTKADYTTLYKVQENGGSYASDRSLRRDCKNDLKKGAVIGYYGGVDAVNIPKGDVLKAPTVEIINAEKLQIRVTNYNAAQTGSAVEDKLKNSLTLMIASTKNPAVKMKYELIKDGEVNTAYGTGTTFLITLDDVTASNGTGKSHFSDQFETAYGFNPGENITVSATAFNNKVVTNIADSGETVTNSLFDSYDTDNGIIYVSNIRHF